MPKCLVTGGAGFIGSHLATQLVEAGWQVRLLDNLCTGSTANFAHIESDVDFLEGDVANPVLSHWRREVWTSSSTRRLWPRCR